MYAIRSYYVHPTVSGFRGIRGCGGEGEQYVEFVQFHDDLLLRGSSIGMAGFASRLHDECRPFTNSDNNSVRQFPSRLNIETFTSNGAEHVLPPQLFMNGGGEYFGSR